MDRELIQVISASALLMLLVALMVFGLKAAFGADSQQGAAVPYIRCFVSDGGM
jgi:hypothetical protein